MFSSQKLFSQVLCPDAKSCVLPTCLFQHGKPSQKKEAYAKAIEAISNNQDGLPKDENSDLPRKRPRLSSETVKSGAIDEPHLNLEHSGHSENGRPKEISPIKSDQPSEEPLENQAVFMGLRLAKQGHRSQTSSTTATPKREISPPLLCRDRKPQFAPPTLDNTAASHGTQDTSHGSIGKAKESLNPRIVPRAPAKHEMRLALLRKLHEQIVRLSDEHKKQSSEEYMSIKLSPQDIIIMALDEEEKIARQSPSVYRNVMGHRVVALKKMKLDDWRKSVIASKSDKKVSTPSPSAPKVISSGLSPYEEVAVLTRFQASSSDLEKLGYVTSVPTDKEIAEAKAGIEASIGWEVCDRCTTRFRVFPGRRAEDGALTAGGKCQYHWGKAPWPTKSKTGSNTRSKDRIYTCCNEPIGESSGCTKADTHVFKVSDRKRLAHVLQFQETPANGAIPSSKAICVDCEMCYTVHGLELIRLTATDWPTGEEVIDVLVRPLGEILDLNSRYSGVWPSHFTEALAYDESSVKDTSDESGAPIPTLRMVPSPMAARTLLFTQISANTPLIGHALENDLNALRIIHPFVIDTVLLYPHRRGLPYRNGLKMLMYSVLEKTIQNSTIGQGHDSKEDARAAGELLRWKVLQEWPKLAREGWSFQDGVLCPPSLKEPQNRQVLGPGRIKRKRSIGPVQRDGEEDGEIIETVAALT
ncbi:MAG: RNA exonuclease 3 [Vezdaea acicularis]|nr:MAG: RNA exonuclease 3 [Vezdaea acicularis]